VSPESGTLPGRIRTTARPIARAIGYYARVNGRQTAVQAMGVWWWRAAFAAAVSAAGPAVVELPLAQAPTSQIGVVTPSRDGLGGGGHPGAIEGHETAVEPAATQVRAPAAATVPYTFYPQAGVLGQDITVVNFVDLAPGPAIADFDCTDVTYDAHNGHDSTIRGFREQALGVPIFAALDGMVTSAVDGYPDEETTNLAGRPTNFVTIAHAGGYRTQYLHMKRNSVAVTVGQVVRTGQQLGLTGSSGNSSWPHLHFTSFLNNVAFEPNSGACRSGASQWQSQVPIRRDAHAISFTFGTAPFSGTAGYPFDQVVRLGTLVRNSAVFFRVVLGYLPLQSTYRMVFVRPNGSVARDVSGPFNNTAAFRQPWFWFAMNSVLDVTGAWMLEFHVNGVKIVTAPFDVVTTAAEIANRPPLPISVALDPGDDPPICRVTPAAVYRVDPDYDLVRYRYQWFIRGAGVRDVTSAALSDAISSGLAAPGDEIRCTVTPLDQTTAGPAATATNLTPLSAPIGLAYTLNESALTFTWGRPLAGTPTAYVLEAGSAAGLANLGQVTIGAAATSYSVVNVPPGTFFIRLRAVGAAGPSAPSNEVTLTYPVPLPPPAAPRPPMVSVSGNTATIVWTQGAGSVPTHYLIHAGSTSGATDLGIFNVGPGTRVAVALGPGHYFIRIVAANAFGQSPPSDEASWTIGGPPGPPGTPTATLNGSHVTVAWTAPQSGGAPTYYLIEAGSTSGATDIGIFNVGAARSVAAAIAPGSYFVRIVAVNSLGQSAASGETTFTLVR